MLRNSSVLLILSMLSVCLFSSTSQAQSPYLESQLFSQRGYGVGGMLYSLGYAAVPPYFALHPPVYYSHSVPRTYGYSPFAYSGNVRTPQVEETKPVAILNPFASPKKKAVKKEERSASHTSIIKNPFATNTVNLSTEKLVRVLQ